MKNRYLVFVIVLACSVMGSAISSQTQENEGLKGKYVPGMYTALHGPTNAPTLGYLRIDENGKIAGLFFDIISSKVEDGNTVVTTRHAIGDNYNIMKFGEQIKGVKPVGEWYQQANALCRAIINNQGWDLDWKMFYRDVDDDGEADFVDVNFFSSHKDETYSNRPDAISGCTIHIEEFVVIWNMLIAQAQAEEGGKVGMSLDSKGNPYLKIAPKK